MRILLTVPSLGLDFGGPVGKARALATAFSHLGHEVTLAGAGRPASGNEVGLPTVARFHATPIPFARHRVARAARDAEVVHVIGYRDPVGAAAARAARRSGVAYLLEPVGMLRRRIRSLRLKAVYDRTLGRAVVSGAALIVATSRIEARELTEDGIEASRVVVRANGLDLAALNAPVLHGRFRKRLGLDTGTPLVLSLGRITAKKGLPLLVEAIARVPDAHLAIVGPDERDGSLEAVRDAAARCGIAERLHLMDGGLWGTEKVEALIDADVFCLFSQTENFGVAPAEAAACGVATIVSDQCGVAEWLRDGVEVVPYGDVRRLTASIERLLQNPRERRALGERGRVASRALSWETIARQQLALYRQVLHPAR